MSTNPHQTMTEITPLSDTDCFYIVDRLKNKFDFPIHQHKEFELNLITNCKGGKRIVGDSVEDTGDTDLTIIGSGLEHVWSQSEIEETREMREITIQWDNSPYEVAVTTKTPFLSIKKMLDKAKYGITFGSETIKRVMPLFDELLGEIPGFVRFLKFWHILWELSVSNDYRELSTSSFANIPDTDTSRRITKIKAHIAAHYTRPIKLEALADIAGMTPTAFSRFFKSQTNKTLQDYIIDIRLGHAIRALVDTSMSTSEVCYTCGFNNISNFNRLFKKKKGCTPMEFRKRYNKNKIII